MSCSGAWDKQGWGQKKYGLAVVNKSQYLKEIYPRQKLEVYEHYHGACQHCSKEVVLQAADMHHLKYLPGYMDKPLDPDTVTLLCKVCHRVEHLDRHPICHNCGRIAIGGHDRMRACGLDYPLCRKCWLMRRGRQEQVGQYRLPIA